MVSFDIRMETIQPSSVLTDEFGCRVMDLER
jgi:hypothetical protein